MRQGWSLGREPLFALHCGFASTQALEVALCQGREDDDTRLRLVASVLADAQRAAPLASTVKVGGEVVLDLEAPAFAAILADLPTWQTGPIVELLRDWAYVAQMPHRERDVFHLPCVPPIEGDAPETVKLAQDRRRDYEVILSDYGRVGLALIREGLA